MPRQNPLDNRVALLTEKLKDRMGGIRKNLTEPKPYRQQRVDEETQVRKYLQLRDTGGLVELRERMGDDQVNSYVSAMQGRAQKYLNAMAARENIDAKEPSEIEVNRQPGEPVASFYTADDDLESF